MNARPLSPADEDPPGVPDAALVRRLSQILAASPLVSDALARLQRFRPESLWLGAGAICDTVWNAAHGFDPAHGIVDLDIVYFDPGLTPDDDARVAAEVTGLVEHLGVWADVKNQANVHLWYPTRFGSAIPPYASLEDAVATWPTTAGAIAVRPTDEGLAVAAPFGLNDLFGLVLRANRVQAPRWWYERKCARWHAEWPALRILDWDDGIGEAGARLIQP